DQMRTNPDGHRTFLKCRSCPSQDDPHNRKEACKTPPSSRRKRHIRYSLYWTCRRNAAKAFLAQAEQVGDQGQTWCTRLLSRVEAWDHPSSRSTHILQCLSYHDVPAV